MLKHISIFFVALGLSFFGLRPSGFAQEEPSCATAKALKRFLDENHVNAGVLKEDFSQSVTQSLVMSLDSRGLFLTKADLSGPLADFLQLEAAFEEGNCTFVSQLDLHLKTRLTYINEFLERVDYDQVINAGGYESDLKSASDLPDDLPSLEQRWLAYLKRSLYDRKYLRSTEAELAGKDIKELFEQVREAERCSSTRKLALLEEEDFLAKAFYSALARAYDPHTNYYNYGFVELLEAFLEEERPSFGFQLVENRFGQVSIGKLLPGGPAWRSNQLHVGDVLTGIHLPDGSAIDLNCSGLAEAKKLVAGSVKSAEITVIDKSRQLKTVKLVKEKVVSSENAVRGYLLQGEKRVGYISLPDFYTSEGQDDEERGCARDMAREIIKLKSDGIEGLILDVRNNGGGSLQEALDLIGIFIDEGPLALMKKSGNIQVIGDRSRGAAYSGPLIILVNGQSASASELLAASLQDYKRALIVGDTTFGKAVGQEMEVLGSFFNKDNKDKIKPAIVKVTTSRLYRLKGQSYQQLGVVPDIHLPELSVIRSGKEATYPFSVIREDIERDTYFKAYPDMPTTQLRQLHQQRLAESGLQNARALTDSAKHINERLANAEAADFLKMRALNDKRLQLLQDVLETNTSPYNVSNHSFDKMIISMSPRKKQIEEMTFQGLKNNIYVRQAYEIMADLINSTK